MIVVVLKSLRYDSGQWSEGIVGKARRACRYTDSRHVYDYFISSYLRAHSDVASAKPPRGGRGVVWRGVAWQGAMTTPAANHAVSLFCLSVF